MGKCLYFELGSGTHNVFYELSNRRIKWIWYINQLKPQLRYFILSPFPVLCAIIKMNNPEATTEVMCCIFSRE